MKEIKCIICERKLCICDDPFVLELEEENSKLKGLIRELIETESIDYSKLPYDLIDKI